MTRPRRPRVSLAELPFDTGADGPAQPRRQVVEIDHRRRDPRTGLLGRPVKVKVARRLPSRALAAMPETLRDAAELFCKATEEVQAGGVVTPTDDRRSLGGPRDPRTAPCAQFRALQATEWLRRLEGAVGGGAVAIRRRKGFGGQAIIAHLTLVRAITVEDVGVDAVLDRNGIAKGGKSRARLVEALRAALERIAQEAGLEPKPKPARETS